MKSMEALKMALSAQRRQELIEELAEKVNRWGLSIPALLLLEAHRPLSFIASQTLIFSRPFLSPLLGEDKVSEYAMLLEDRAGLDSLIERIERSITGGAD